MPTQDINNANVFPEDLGTDAPTDYSQPDSAGFFGGLARHETYLNYVETGLDFSPDYGASTVDITGGLVFLLIEADVDVQDQNGDYSRTWGSGMALAVDVPPMTGISLTSGAVNRIYLAVDRTQGDGAYYQIETDSTTPVDAYIEIGHIDTGAQTVELLNRDLVGSFDSATVSSVSDTDPSAVTNRDYVDSEIESAGAGSDPSFNSATVSNVNGSDSTAVTNVGHVDSAIDSAVPSSIVNSVDGMSGDVTLPRYRDIYLETDTSVDPTQNEGDVVFYVDTS